MKTGNFIKKKLTVASIFFSFIVAANCQLIQAADNSEKTKIVKPLIKLTNEKTSDQDDYTVWINHDNPESSFIISSDKSANSLFVYDLSGKKVDEISANKPGNIDTAYGFPLGKELVDIIVVNQRETPRLLIVCTINPKSGQLTRIDNDKLLTEKNYGGCLYHNKLTNEFYFISTSKSQGVTQYELYDDNGTIASRALRAWDLGKSEGAVANDDKGLLYIAEEQKGVWKLGANPEEDTPGELIIKIDDHGLQGDIEGLAILKISEKESYLLLSDQDANTFKVYREEEGYPFVGNFKVDGAMQSDGIEIIHAPLGSQFSQGLFVCHTDKGSRSGLVVPLDRILPLIRSEK